MAAVQHEIGGRDRIVLAARTLFATQGFHQTSIAELAVVARVSVGQIYRLFTGKSDIILAIVRSDAGARMPEMVELVARVKAGTVPVADCFRQLTLHVFSEKDEALSFEILAEAHRNSAVADMIAELCVGYRAVLREMACLANPALDEGDLDGAEEMLLALIFGLGHRALSGPRLSLEETAARITGMILSALKVPG